MPVRTCWRRWKSITNYLAETAEEHKPFREDAKRNRNWKCGKTGYGIVWVLALVLLLSTAAA